MATPATRTVAMVLFPFSDLSDAKLRPAVILAQANRSDWVLCQITSKPYADTNAVEITMQTFNSARLPSPVMRDQASSLRRTKV